MAALQVSVPAHVAFAMIATSVALLRLLSMVRLRPSSITMTSSVLVLLNTSIMAAARPVAKASLLTRPARFSVPTVT